VANTGNAFEPSEHFIVIAFAVARYAVSYVLAEDYYVKSVLGVVNQKLFVLTCVGTILFAFWDTIVHRA
jgi:uncharacterized membrane protein